uniref:DUF58 domain-containing protein n=1 Tax=Tenacibaculum sp. Pbs-1 TaxID=3238748 RepID=A0AB33KV23_9FLAO
MDVETGEEINLYAENVQQKYQELSSFFFKNLKNKCLQYKIDYIPVDISEGYDKVLIAYLITRQNFL